MELHGINVETSKGFSIPYNREKIIASLINETQYAEKFYNIKPMSRNKAEFVAKVVENKITQFNMSNISGRLIREIVNSVLLEYDMPEYKELYSRIGMPVFDAYSIDIGELGHGDNANLQANAETTHKRKADMISKEEALCLLPVDIRDMHNSGDIHIHDLEYFTTRIFCQDHDLRYLFRYGFYPDGTGKTASVAEPAKRAEVAVLHAVKLLAAAQCSCAGGQGYYNFLTFLAPYFEGLDYNDIKQLMQMFVYEMTQMFVARGGQVVFSSVQLTVGVPKLWQDRPIVYKGLIWNGKEAPLRTYGEFEREVRLMFKALMDVMYEGDALHKPFVFPKPEIGIEWEFMTEKEDFNRENPDLPTYNELYLMSFALASKFGTPYFDNMLPKYRDSENGIQCYQCVPDDTTVIMETEHGLRVVEISELENNKCRILSNELSDYDTLYVKDVECELYSFKLPNGREIKCSGDHEIPVMRDGRMEKILAKSISIGDVVRINNRLPTHGVDFDEFKKGFVKSDNIISDQNIAYLIGAIVAEGNMLIRPSKIGGSRLQISFNKSESDFASKIKEILEQCGYTVKETIVRDNEYRIYVYSKKLCEYLISKSISRTTGQGNRIPDFIFTANNDCKFAFLHGFCRGDASYYNNGVHIQCTSHEFMIGLQMLFGSLGIRTGMYSISTRDMYSMDILANFVKNYWSCTVIDENIEQYDEIVNIERIPYKGKLYDFVNVTDNHEFRLANGVMVGNCCAYSFSATMDQDEHFDEKMNFINGQHFSMGSYMVTTLNLPRIAYRSDGTADGFIRDAKKMIKKVSTIFKVKKQFMEEIRKANRMPFLTQRPVSTRTGEKAMELVDFDSLVYTIGIIGMNEVIEHICGTEIQESEESIKTAMYIMVELKQYIEELSAKSGINIAFARTPAETTGQRFATSDLLHPIYSEFAKKYIKGDIDTAIDVLKNGKFDTPIYYTNGTHTPPNANIPITKRISTEEKFFPLVDGGNIMHIWMGEAYPDPRGLMDMCLNICKNTNVGYFAITRDMTIASIEYETFIKIKS